MDLKKSAYLYGDNFDPTILSEMNYVHALRYKIESAKHTRDELLHVHYSKRDGTRIKRIGDAIAFNNALIDEAEGRESNI